MDKLFKITQYFSQVGVTKEHSGYFFNVGEVLTIVILGSLCGLRNINQISQWSKDGRVSKFLARHFGVERVPCYYWLLCLLKIIDPKSLNECLMRWTQSFLPDGVRSLTLSFDGKTIRSTGKMDRYDKPIHIVSAHIAELGLTFASHKTDDKSNEIPAMRELLEIMDIEGCIVVADAIHCQKETAAAIVAKKADDILSVKDNQATSDVFQNFLCERKVATH